MKRTALQRRTPLRKANPKRLAARRAVQFGPQAELCRQMPCAACGAPPPSDPHHTTSRGAGGTDESCAPVCRECHTWIHQVGFDTFNQSREIELSEVARGIALVLNLSSGGA